MEMLENHASESSNACEDTKVQLNELNSNIFLISLKRIEEILTSSSTKSMLYVQRERE